MPPSQDCINTLAFWTGQLVLSQNDPRLFLNNLINLQRDLEVFRKKLVPRQIVDDTEDEDLVSPL